MGVALFELILQGQFVVVDYSFDEVGIKVALTEFFDFVHQQRAHIVQSLSFLGLAYAYKHTLVGQGVQEYSGAESSLTLSDVTVDKT